MDTSPAVEMVDRRAMTPLTTEEPDSRTLRVSLIRRDDSLQLAVNDLAPVTLRDPLVPVAADEDWLYLRFFNAETVLTSARVHVLSEAEYTSPLQSGEKLQLSGLPQRALNEYLALADEFHGKRLGVRALERAAALAIELEETGVDVGAEGILGRLLLAYDGTPDEQLAIYQARLAKLYGELDRFFDHLEAYIALGGQPNMVLELLRHDRRIFSTEQAQRASRILVSLPHQRNLDLSHLQLTAVPDLKEQQYNQLFLHGNRLVDVSALAGKDLYRLYLHDNKDLINLQPLQHTKVQHLTLSGTGITDQHLSYLSQSGISSLDASNTAVTEPWVHLRGLQGLNLDGNSLSGSFPLDQLPVSTFRAGQNRLTGFSSTPPNHDMDVLYLGENRSFDWSTMPSSSMQSFDVRGSNFHPRYFADGSVMRTIVASNLSEPSRLAEFVPHAGLSLHLGRSPVRADGYVQSDRLLKIDLNPAFMQPSLVFDMPNLEDLKFTAKNPVESSFPKGFEQQKLLTVGITGATLITWPNSVPLPERIFIDRKSFSPALRSQLIDRFLKQKRFMEARLLEIIAVLAHKEYGRLQGLAQEYGDRRWLVVPGPLTRVEAKALAKRAGADLGRVDSVATADWLYAKVRATGGAHIGFRYGAGKVVWSDGGRSAYRGPDDSRRGNAEFAVLDERGVWSTAHPIDVKLGAVLTWPLRD